MRRSILKLEALRAAVAAEPRDIARINIALRALLQKVVVDWQRARLVLHWSHGGQTSAMFNRQRQRSGARNRTPAPPQRAVAPLAP